MRTQVLCLAAVAVTAAAGGASSALADQSGPTFNQLCYSATVTTAPTGTRTVGPVCLPYPGPTLCGPTDVNLQPFGDVTLYTCEPAPKSNEVSTAGQ